MISREDILSMEYLKKSEYTGCCQGMRYRLEGMSTDDGKILAVTVWPEPFNYFKTPEERKHREKFAFSEEGVVEAIAWMNEQLEKEQELFGKAWDNWSEYKME